MAPFEFTADDVSGLEARGTTPDQVLAQIELFRKGIRPTRLIRPCTLGDGIRTLSSDSLETLSAGYDRAMSQGRALKFVPASGAATRMFKFLMRIYQQYPELTPDETEQWAVDGDADQKAWVQFIRNIDSFAFTEALSRALAADGYALSELISHGPYHTLIEYLMTPKGLGYGGMPKGLVLFHRYADGARTAFAEHVAEAAAYAQDQHGIARLHFTVPEPHQAAIKRHIETVIPYYARAGVQLEIGFSIQKPATDTITVDMHNTPLRDAQGRLVFRPGGHGALIENIQDLSGDIIFIKNIDNVVPDQLKTETIRYKKTLGGLLVQLQESIFGYLKQLEAAPVEMALMEKINAFMVSELGCSDSFADASSSPEELRRLLFTRLHRPLRVCGVVPNTGEPGGGPFWVADTDGNMSLQLVESSQVNMASDAQRGIWQASTHFSPVDLVCGLRDYQGRPFILNEFVDPSTAFIATKSKDGQPIKALEHPGLWNGAMAHWNTVFVEVPLTTFNPVKTVNDLLRAAHVAVDQTLS